jgi:nitroreductase
MPEDPSIDLPASSSTPRTELPYRTRRTSKPHQMDSGRAVPDAVLREILEDASWAPTHGLTQPWRFHVFIGDSRQRLAEGLQSLYDATTPIAQRKEDKRAKLRTNALAAPVVVAVAARIEPGGKISELDEICATACAVQNMLLSAHERGVASFWASPPVACSGGFAEWLGLDSTHRALGLVFLGYARDASTTAPSRLPLAERVVFHSE